MVPVCFETASRASPPVRRRVFDCDNRESGALCQQPRRPRQSSGAVGPAPLRTFRRRTAPVRTPGINRARTPLPSGHSHGLPCERKSRHRLSNPVAAFCWFDEGSCCPFDAPKEKTRDSDRNVARTAGRLGPSVANLRNIAGK